MFGFKRNNSVRLAVDPAQLPKARNTDGSKGKVCGNCGGYGYTLKLKGGTIDCFECAATGVGAEGIKDMQEKMQSMENEIKTLKKAVIEELRKQGVPVPKTYK